MDFQSFIHEPGGDKEYGFIVVRQQTGGGGYHTSEADYTRLFEPARQVLEKLPQR